MGKAEPYRPLRFCSKCFMHQWGTVRTGADGDLIVLPEPVAHTAGIYIVLASWVNVTTSLQLRDATGKVFLNLQKQLDAIYPGLLTVIVTWLCWWLMAKRHVSAIWTMIILIVVAFLGVVVGFFNPGLSY